MIHRSRLCRHENVVESKRALPFIGPEGCCVRCRGQQRRQGELCNLSPPLLPFKTIRSLLPRVYFGLNVLPLNLAPLLLRKAPFSPMECQLGWAENRSAMQFSSSSSMHHRKGSHRRRRRQRAMKQEMEISVADPLKRGEGGWRWQGGRKRLMANRRLTRVIV